MKKWIAVAAVVLAVAVCFGLAFSVRDSHVPYTWDMLMQQRLIPASDLFYPGENGQPLEVDAFASVAQGSEVIAVARCTGEKTFNRGQIYHKFLVKSVLKGQCPEQITVYIPHNTGFPAAGETDNEERYAYAVAGILDFDTQADYLLCLNSVPYDPLRQLPAEKENPYAPFGKKVLGIYKLTAERTQSPAPASITLEEAVRDFQVLLGTQELVDQYNALQDEAVAYAREHGVTG